MAYYFPPMLGGEVARIHAFVKYLPQAGCIPRVLTVDPRVYGDVAYDESLLAEYADSVEIVRTPSLISGGRMAQAVRSEIRGSRSNQSMVSAIVRRFLTAAYQGLVIPDGSALWLPYALRAGLALAREWRPDVILATTPPHGTGVIAALLSRLTATPLVLDVRDNWIGNPAYARKARLPRWIEQRLERFVIRTSSRVIVSTDESRLHLQTLHPDRAGEWVQTIFNGFDPDHFSRRPDRQVSSCDEACLPERNGRMRMVYAGNVWPKRSPRGLFEALRDLARLIPGLAEELEVIFVGNMPWEYQTMIGQLGLSEFVTYRGFWKQREYLQLLSTADVGLVIIPSSEGSQTAIPAKIYEYMVAGMYSLVLADPDSAVGRLVARLGIGLIAPQDDPVAIVEALRAILNRSRRGDLAPQLGPEQLKQFNRAEQTRQLAEVVDGLFAPGPKPGPLVSIVIPTFNRARLLPEAIGSALAQSYPAVEVVVVNDGSTDSTSEVLREFGERIVSVTQAHHSAGAARNAGLQLARGELIAFLDDDDTLTQQAVARRVDVLLARPEVGIVYSDLYVMNEAGSILGRYSAERRRPLPSGDLYEALLPRNFIPTHAMLWRRSVLERAGGFPERSVSEDWECLLKAAEHTRIQYLDEPLGCYRLHAGNITHRRVPLVQGYGIVQQLVAGSVRFAQVPARRRAWILTRYAAQQWLEGDPALARSFWQMARRADPLNPWPMGLGLLMLAGQSFVRRWVYGLWRIQARMRLTATSYFRQNR